MYHCDICNTKYKRLCDLHHHYKTKNNFQSHKQLLIDDIYSQLPENTKNKIEILDVLIHNNNNRVKKYDLYYVYNKECNHYSYLEIDHLLRGHMLCSVSECKKKAKGDTTKKLMQNKIYLENWYNGMYKARKSHAEGVAESQRRKANKDEIYFKDLLEKYNIKYIWQAPYISEEKEYVFDFYLMDYDLYINIDGGIHKNNGFKLNAYSDELNNLNKFANKHNIKIKNICTDDLINNFNIELFLRGDDAHA